MNTPLPRRTFIKQAAVGSAVLAAADWNAFGAAAGSAPSTSVPWFKRALRWGQTNITEIDPTRYNIDWWRSHWKRTRVQGVVVNAGGIVAYYPTEVPFHYRAEFLGDRDMFGDLVAAAHEDGLAVFARMDSHRAHQDFYDAHPDWFAHDAEGKPYMATGFHIACVNSPYYDEHIPSILREVASKYRPEGFTDNNWNGPMRHQPCYCGFCQRSFNARAGAEIPREVDWNSDVYREWIMWNYDRRLEIWDMFNRATREAGGPECIWVGMMAGSQNWQSRVFRDDREVYRRTEMVMLDDQRRFDGEGFQHNGEIGKRIRAVGGWDKVIPESMAMYHLTDHNFRLATKPVPEVRMWVVEGFAGGVQPWWHHVGTDQHDRRMFETAPPLWQWHEENERYLVNRRPLDTVGVLWSQRNTDFFGRDDSGAHVSEPWNGFTQALVRARIPYIPVHLDDIEREAASLKLLILPNLGGMSDAQVASVRKFVDNGGHLLATGLSSLCNEWGDVREDFALSDVLGVSLPASHPVRDEAKRLEWATQWKHTYLRLLPELRAGVNGPDTGREPPVAGSRHEVLGGFDGTDILAFGGMLASIDIDSAATVPLTFIPPVSYTPAESVWMREPKTVIPGLVLNERANGSRVAYLPADIDRQFSRENIPDHGDLLANIVRWTVKGDLPVEIEGPGLIDCHVYEQPGRVVLHLVNLTSAGTWRTPVHELIAVGPHTVRVRLPAGVAGGAVRSIVSGKTHARTVSNGWVEFTSGPTTDHDVFVIG